MSNHTKMPAPPLMAYWPYFKTAILFFLIGIICVILALTLDAIWNEQYFLNHLHKQAQKEALPSSLGLAAARNCLQRAKEEYLTLVKEARKRYLSRGRTHLRSPSDAWRQSAENVGAWSKECKEAEEKAKPYLQAVKELKVYAKWRWIPTSGLWLNKPAILVEMDDWRDRESCYGSRSDGRMDTSTNFYGSMAQVES